MLLYLIRDWFLMCRRVRVGVVIDAYSVVSAASPENMVLSSDAIELLKR